MAQLSKKQTTCVHPGAPHLPSLDHAAKVALQYHVDYPTCLGMVREARNRGLTAPVILMGKYMRPVSFRINDSLMQVIITLCSRTGSKRPSRMRLKQELTALSSSTYLRRRLYLSARSVRQRGGSSIATIMRAPHDLDGPVWPTYLSLHLLRRLTAFASSHLSRTPSSMLCPR